MVLESKFLTGLIPDEWEEIVHDEDNQYRVHVIGEPLTDKKWAKLAKDIKNEFGDELKEIFIIKPNGVNFEIVLRK